MALQGDHGQSHFTDLSLFPSLKLEVTISTIFSFRGGLSGLIATYAGFFHF